jgi:(4S)-4-hydroxy-5-phosphonooxypentane-2,3-dione isomerase
MPKLAIVATVEIQPGHLDECLRVLVAHKARCLKDEPGTLQFDVLRPNEGDTRVMIYEVYQDEAAFNAHWNGPSTARAREEAGKMFVKITGVRCTPVE